VIDSPYADAASLLPELGEAAAELVTEITTPDDVLGLPWSRAVSAMTNALTTLPTIPVVRPPARWRDPTWPTRRSTWSGRPPGRRARPAHFFYAPTVVPDARTARALRQQPDIARALARIRFVTKAVVGVGLWGPAESTVYDATDETARATLERHGACAEVSGVLVDADGRAVGSELTQRIIGISAAELRAIPDVIAIAYNAVRAPAIGAAILGKLVTGVVTHPAVATALITSSQGP
jgi:DNA-binding transcriptional regulator LsrR (DeoR family)